MMSTKDIVFVSTAALVVALLGWCTSGAIAHEGTVHVMGTISALAPGSITVLATDGQTRVIGRGPATTYRKGEEAAAAADLTVGTRVVIEVTGEGKNAVASEVRFSAREAHSESGGASAPGTTGTPGSGADHGGHDHDRHH